MFKTSIVICVLVGLAVAVTPPGTLVLPSWPTPYFTRTTRGTFSSPDHRSEDVTLIAELNFPSGTSQSDGTIFEAGCTGAGTFIGLYNNEFVVAAGQGTGTTTDDYTAVLKVPLSDTFMGSIFDGGFHEVGVKLWPDLGRVELHIDGHYVKTETTLNGKLHTSGLWAGGNAAGFGESNGCTTEATGVTASWPGTWSGSSKLTLYLTEAGMTPSPINIATPGTVVEGNWPAPYETSSNWNTVMDSPSNRDTNVAVVMQVTLPTPGQFADGTLFETGCGGAGAWIGIKGTNFVVAGGQGAANSDYTALLAMPLANPSIAAYFDGNAHEVAVKYWPAHGKLDLFFDGTWVGQAVSTAGQLYDSSPLWGGSNPAGFGRTNDCVTDAVGVVAAWPVGTQGQIKFYLISGSPHATPSPQRPPVTCDGACLLHRCAGGALRTTDDGIASIRVTGTTTGTVWGTTHYSSDSDVGAAAVHAGVLNDGETKLIRIQCGGPRSDFTSSTAHGVTTVAWTPSYQAFSFVAAAPVPEPAVCYHWHCAMSKCFVRGQQFELVVTGIASSENSIYGSHVYTDDSDIRLAAVHSGVLQAGETATLTVMCYGPQEAFPSTTMHGITSASWSYWGFSWALAKS